MGYIKAKPIWGYKCIFWYKQLLLSQLTACREREECKREDRRVQKEGIDRKEK